MKRLFKQIIFSVFVLTLSATQVSAAQCKEILETLGLPERILVGGGIKIKANGEIEPLVEPLDVRIFDFDDNIMHLATHIYVRHKDNHDDIKSMHTVEYAIERSRVGETGKYKDYEIWRDAHEGSFQDFRDINNPDIFPDDVESVIKNDPAQKWRGPAWLRWAFTMKNPKTRQWAGILTSRGQWKESILRGLSLLVEAEYLEGLPRGELIFTIKSPEITAKLPSLNEPQRKREVLLELLDLIESIPLKNEGDFHKFEFSDDDFHMLNLVKKRVQKEAVKNERWPHIQITLITTTPGKESRFVIPQAVAKK